MRDYLLIYVNGQRHQLRGRSVFQSLSDYLRRDLGLTGTKVVCAEGDCGSCTVFVGRPRGASIEYVTVCSCIAFVYQLDACHIVTVEGLSENGKLNPVQEAMVRCQGTQCGFCTPGFVVSMCAMFESDAAITEPKLRRGLIGNLCRCTGYEPILRAGLQVDRQQIRTCGQLYDSPPMRDDLAKHDAQSLRIQAEENLFFKPITIADAVKFKSERADCTIIAGGTDLGVQMNKGICQVRTAMSVSAIAELRELTTSPGQIVAGGGVSISDFQTALAKSLPPYAEFLEWFGSPPIRNGGTLGGNIANASPIGDSMPALFVLNAEIELAGVAGARRVNINDFYTGYKKTLAAPDELISRVFIPLPAANQRLLLYKVSKRKDLDISTFAAAFWIQTTGNRIDDIRIAYGGVGPRILRLPETEALLRGNEIDEELFDTAGQTAVAEITPITDVRGSADYRNRLASTILHKLYFDLASQFSAVPEGRASVGKNGNGRPAARKS